jgi:hypothetical protein
MDLYTKQLEQQQNNIISSLRLQAMAYKTVLRNKSLGMTIESDNKLLNDKFQRLNYERFYGNHKIWELAVNGKITKD